MVIPVFNQARYISECLENALNQTYKNIEVIVVDDGSEDNLYEKLLPYQHKIQIHKRKHQGGNSARNFGLSQASGTYIQFLDADDYILPHKISEDIKFLKNNFADVLYRDWRHKYMNPDSYDTYGDVQTSGEHQDMLYALLSGWWVAPCAVLIAKEKALQIDGWDESLFAAQDTDFMCRLALSGAVFKYLPGSTSIYRRHGPTVSTSNKKRWLDSHVQVLRKIEKDLTKRSCFSSRYKKCMATRYFGIAQNYFRSGNADYKFILKKIHELDPEFSGSGSRLYRTTYKYLGFRASEYLAMFRQDLISRCTIKNI